MSRKFRASLVLLAIVIMFAGFSLSSCQGAGEQGGNEVKITFDAVCTGAHV